MKCSFYELIIFFLAFQLVLFSQQSTINKSFYSLESIYSNSLVITNGTSAENSSWVEKNSGTTENLNDVVMIDSLTAIVVGNYSSILKTTDAGETWRNTAPEVDCAPGTDCVFNLNSIRFFDKMNGIVAGESVLLITSNGGEEWQFLPKPSFNNFTCISNLMLDNIFIGDDSGYVYNSRDTGKTWTSEHPTSLPIKSIYPLKGIDTQLSEIFALTSKTLLIKSGSAEWKDWGTLGFFLANDSAYKGGFSDNGTHFIVGSYGDSQLYTIIIRLRPPDSYWHNVGIAYDEGTLYGLSIPSSEVIYTCGDYGKIFKSTNYGDNWFRLNTPTTQKLNSIYFFNNDRGFAVGDSGTILYTKTGGISEENNPPSPFNLLEPFDESLMTVPRSLTFKWQAASDPDGDPVNYTVLISHDSGVTWDSYGPVTDQTELQIHSPAPGPGRYFWTVIANDGILATPGIDVFTFNIHVISDVESENIIKEYELSQNFPNPFNPTTKIKFSIPVVETGHASFVQLKIYDILGKEIATLVNEEKPSGEYEVEWNAAGFASGIYYYQLKGDNFKETKKVLLLK